jgi:CRP-like cAMP-binding protein
MRKFKKNEEPFATHLFQSLRKVVELEKSESNLLLRFCTMKRFDKKTILIDVGGMENHIHLIVKGLMRKYIRLEKGEATIQLASEGHIIHSEISYLKRVPSPVVIETLEPTIMISIQFTEMQRIVSHFPPAEALCRKLMEAMYVLKDERVYKMLSMSPRERFLDFVNKNPHMLQRVPQKILASYLDIKPETFSRMKHLIRQSNEL